MIEPLIAIHQEVLKNTPREAKRYLFDQIHWKSQAISILGSRGVGKTTLMCQYLLEKYEDASKALYVSGDNIQLLSYGLFNLAQEYFKYGGKALFIDEVHKYPNWEGEVKNIIDTYRNHQIIFSGSSSLDLQKSKYDLSRRVVYYELKGLSFREYLKLGHELEFDPLTLNQILHHHLKIAGQFKDKVILKHFREYLNSGYFPFFLEGKEVYLSKLLNTIEKVLFEDVAVIYNLQQTTLSILKKLLWLIVTSNGLLPNIDRISKSLGTSRENVYKSLEYLEQAKLIHNIYHDAKGMKLIRKPAKIFPENPNLIYAINGGLKLESESGGLRETFFVNQLSALHRVSLHNTADFLVDGRYTIEVGGKSKKTRQIRGEEEGYLALDGIEIGFGKRIPLFLFGFLY